MISPIEKKIESNRIEPRRSALSPPPPLLPIHVHFSLQACMLSLTLTIVVVELCPAKARRLPDGDHATASIQPLQSNSASFSPKSTSSNWAGPLSWPPTSTCGM